MAQTCRQKLLSALGSPSKGGTLCPDAQLSSQRLSSFAAKFSPFRDKLSPQPISNLGRTSTSVISEEPTLPQTLTQVSCPGSGAPLIRALR